MSGKNLIVQKSDREATSDLFSLLPRSKRPVILSKPLPTTTHVSLHVMGPPKTYMANSGELVASPRPL